MRLTEWWRSFEYDLDSLAKKVVNSQTDPWIAARTMIQQGVQIEGNLLFGIRYANEINKAAIKLGASFFNVPTGKAMHLPDVDSPESFMFALVYHKHLLRYQSINEGNPLAVSQLIEGRPGIEYAANELLRRIDAYCAVNEHLEAVNSAFPEVALQEGATLIEKVDKWLSEEPLVGKLAKQLEAATLEIIEQHNVKKEGLKSLFTKIEFLLHNKVMVLREIAAQKLFIELLKAGILSPKDLANPVRLRQKYPDFAAHWLALDSAVPHLDQRKASWIKGARTAIHTVRYVGSILKSVTYWTIGLITPQYVHNKVGKLIDTVDNLTKAITPDSAKAQRKQLLITHAEHGISRVVAGLGGNQELSISVNDFKNIDAAAVSVLADKIQLIHNLVTLKKCLMLYKKEQNTGFVKFSLSLFIRPLTRLMSASCLRPMIFDRVLLFLEAEKLEAKVDKLIRNVKTEDDFKTEEFKMEMTEVLAQTKTRTTGIPKHSIHVFFKKNSTKETQRLNEVLDIAAPAA